MQGKGTNKIFVVKNRPSLLYTTVSVFISVALGAVEKKKIRRQGELPDNDRRWRCDCKDTSSTYRDTRANFLKIYM
jgi:hypothetical protein